MLKERLEAKKAASPRDEGPRKIIESSSQPKIPLQPPSEPVAPPDSAITKPVLPPKPKPKSTSKRPQIPQLPTEKIAETGVNTSAVSTDISLSEKDADDDAISTKSRNSFLKFLDSESASEEEKQPEEPQKEPDVKVQDISEGESDNSGAVSPQELNLRLQEEVSGSKDQSDKKRARDPESDAETDKENGKSDEEFAMIFRKRSPGPEELRDCSVEPQGDEVGSDGDPMAQTQTPPEEGSDEGVASDDATCKKLFSPRPPPQENDPLSPHSRNRSDEEDEPTSAPEFHKNPVRTLKRTASENIDTSPVRLKASNISYGISTIVNTGLGGTRLKLTQDWPKCKKGLKNWRLNLKLKHAHARSYIRNLGMRNLTL